MGYFEKNYNWDDCNMVSQYDELPLWSSYFGQLLLDNIPLKNYRNYLDIGCGTGFPLIDISQKIGNGCKSYGIDPWCRALERIKLKLRTLELSGIELIESTANEIPFEDEYFDFITSNLGVNNFSEPEKVISECFRVLQNTGTMSITSNLTGTFHEFYEIFKDTLIESGLNKYLVPFQEHVNHRGTVSTISDLFTDTGFIIKKSIESSFYMRFLDGSAFLNHSVILSGFSTAWRNLFATNEIGPFFRKLEKNLNEYAQKYSEFKVSIPMLYLECEKIRSK
jgi:ubiquinone/menaquinone biosynthesis C-methylase UbiE